MRGLIAVLVVVAVLAAGAAGVLFFLQPWAGGVELHYVLSLPPDRAGSPKEAAAETAAVLERRARAMGLGASAVAAPDGRVRLRLAGLRPEDVGPYREAFERKGRFEFLATAPKDVQDRYNADGRLPAGYRIGRPDQVPRGEEYQAWSKGPVLLAEPPVVVTADVVRAEADSQPGPAGFMGAVSLELAPKAAAAFDVLAKDLYNRRPEGMVAIVLDGRIVSMPVLRADAFGGRIHIAGAKDEREARSWAAALAGGELPCLLRPPELGTYKGRLR